MCTPGGQLDNGDPKFFCLGEKASTAPGPSNVDALRFVLAEFTDWTHPSTPTYHAYVPDSLAQVDQIGIFWASPMDRPFGGGPTQASVDDANANVWKIIDVFWARAEYVAPTCFDTESRESLKITNEAAFNAFGKGWRAVPKTDAFDEDMLRCRSKDEIDSMVGCAGAFGSGQIEIFKD